MKALLLGARGAVGAVVHRELSRAGHTVTAAGRTTSGDTGVDLRGDLSALTRLAGRHDVVVNASGIERAGIAAAVHGTPLVDISASGAYLDALRSAADGPVVLGAGLVPGLSTVLVSALGGRRGDDIDVLVMLGSGERHGPAAVTWTAGLVGTDVHRPPEGTPVRNLIATRRETGPDGRSRRYLRADFPDHVLLGDSRGLAVRSYLTLSAAPMTTALAIVGRLPALRGVLGSAPHLGTAAWHLVARNRRTGERRQAQGTGQSEATGRLTALAASRVTAVATTGAMTMADLTTPEDAIAALT
ncbi:saccharopine dehydrogenase [Myceligenerans xiligouense]|uniref:Saccharopine dehydrogenase-like protein n=1 Tax=Myceligenerans xiligouense TaxID=253184 RepID=A0A3N4ZI04_9MICO|nr:saccharopine dehydrogenase [Myceligenerans xiligouense]RPF20495.1 hypothetical protein EDD34_1086 [Myceligenerans xiligouense]